MAIETKSEFITLKDLHQFNNFEILAKKVVEGTIIGLHKSPFHGFSVEFAEHRLYNPGDSLKNIDWKVYGRTDKLFIKRYEEETNLRCRIIIDASSSMYFPDQAGKEGELAVNKLNFSAISSAVLMHILKKQRDAVGISVFTDNVIEHTKAASTQKHQNLIMAKLEQLIANEQLNLPTNAAKCLHEIAENIHKRSLVILFTDMFDKQKDKEELFMALQHLKHNKHEVIVFHVADYSKELDFEFENRPLHFIDMESGEEVKLTSNKIKKEYKAKMQAYKQELYMRCVQYKIDFVEADINKDFRQVLIPYFNKRTKMMV